LGPDSSIEVFPVLGNHDTWPVNVQDFSAPHLNYPINHLTSFWGDSHWLSEEEAQKFSEFGYYSKPLSFNSKGRVLGLNMQACNNLNWWLFDDRSDPGHQIAWLEQELLDLEK
jgi:hypothetical protein